MVIESINILLTIPRSDPADIAARFMHNLSRYAMALTSRLVVENEDKGIWTPKLLAQHSTFQLHTSYITSVCLTMLTQVKHTIYAIVLGTLAKMIATNQASPMLKNHIQTNQICVVMQICLAANLYCLTLCQQTTTSNSNQKTMQSLRLPQSNTPNFLKKGVILKV